MGSLTIAARAPAGRGGTHLGERYSSIADDAVHLGPERLAVGLVGIRAW